jgi:hypothetical protein
MEIVSCPSCDTKARVPTDRGLIKVKCPTCGTRFFYPATSEYSEVQFRCSRDGATFQVVTRRHRPDDRFQIHRIAPLSAAKTRQLVPERAAATAVGAAQATHAADEYDWSGFYCPCCGYIPGKQDTDFVRCGKCSEFVCGESVTKNEETGTKYFRCYPACGEHGKISGTIDEYSGRQRTEANRPEYVSVGSEERERLTGPRSTLPTSPGPAKR